MAKRISVTDTAKLIRQELKSAFPGQKFSVRSKKYSGGASINVSWTDGPNEKQVETIVKNYEGAGFDAYQDMKTYHNSTLNGEEVHFGADYVFCNRTMTDDVVRIGCQHYIEKWGDDLSIEELLQILRNGGIWGILEEIQIRDLRNMINSYTTFQEEEPQQIEETVGAEHETQSEILDDIEEDDTFEINHDVIRNQKIIVGLEDALAAMSQDVKALLPEIVAEMNAKIQSLTEENVRLQDLVTPISIEPCEETVDLMLPYLNKNNTLEEYWEQILDPNYEEITGKVTERITLSQTGYDTFIDNLLTDFSWLAGKGGYDEHGIFVVAVQSEGRQTLYVDPEGHDYARYVGFSRQKHIIPLNTTRTDSAPRQTVAAKIIPLDIRRTA